MYKGIFFNLAKFVNENFNQLKEWDLSKVKNLVISRRCSVSDHKEFKKFLKKNNIKLILDNDDFWELPKSNPARKHYENVEKKNILNTIKIADEIWTPSEYLKNRMAMINPDVFVVSPMKRATETIMLGFQPKMKQK